MKSWSLIWWINDLAPKKLLIFKGYKYCGILTILFLNTYRCSWVSQASDFLEFIWVRSEWTTKQNFHCKESRRWVNRLFQMEEQITLASWSSWKGASCELWFPGNCFILPQSRKMKFYFMKISPGPPSRARIWLSA